MRVTVLHNQVAADAAPDDRDVLVQVERVSAALEGLGHRPEPYPCTLDLGALAEHLERTRPEVAFNLVESLGGSDRLVHLVPVLLDALGVAYSGSPTEAIFLTTGKLLAKEWLTGAGLPVPPCAAAWPEPPPRPGTGPPPAGEYIIKSTWDHGSRGLGDGAVVRAAGTAELGSHLAAAGRRLGPCFAEPYLAGREFNLSLLASPGGPRVLPPAEIEFVAYPPGKPRIVGYRAKWRPGSFEYRNTRRRFDFPPADRRLLGELERLAARCWNLFGLRGYARVDFRVDGEGRPWILEVNANPCLSPDAGFAAALERAGVAYDEAVGRILAAALAAPGAAAPAAGGGAVRSRLAAG